MDRWSTFTPAMFWRVIKVTSASNNTELNTALSYQIVTHEVATGVVSHNRYHVWSESSPQMTQANPTLTLEKPEQPKCSLTHPPRARLLLRWPTHHGS